MVTGQSRAQAGSMAGTGRWCAAGVSLFAAGCATGGLSTNSINSKLNAWDSVPVARSERVLETLKLEELASTSPICIAYRMPSQGAPLTPAMTDTIETISRVARKNGLGVETAEIRHARYDRDTGGAFPSDQVVPLTQLLKQQFPEVAAEYQPISKSEFRSTSNCGDKESAFVDIERLTFFKSTMPAATIWQGNFTNRDVMYIVLRGKTVNQEGKT